MGELASYPGGLGITQHRSPNPSLAADGGRDVGLADFLVAQRGLPRLSLSFGLKQEGPRTGGPVTMRACVREQSWLKVVVELECEPGSFLIEYNGRGLGYESVLVNGRLAVRTRSWLWFAPRLEFQLVALPAAIEVRVWPWFAMRSLELFIDGQEVPLTPESSPAFPGSACSAVGGPRDEPTGDPEAEADNTFRDPLYSATYPARRILAIAFLIGLLFLADDAWAGRLGNLRVSVVRSIGFGLTAIVLQSIDWWVRKSKGPRSREQAQEQCRIAHWMILALCALFLLLAFYSFIILQNRSREILTMIFLALFVTTSAVFFIVNRSYKWYGMSGNRKQQYRVLLIAAVFSAMITGILAIL
jgi:hypothetical protein